MSITEKSYFMKGISEGLFDINLELVIDKDKSIREKYLQGYVIGKEKKSKLTEQDMIAWNANRQNYIKIIGYKVGYEDYEATSENLKEKDLEIFNEGYILGKQEKDLEQLTDEYVNAFIDNKQTIQSKGR